MINDESRVKPQPLQPEELNRLIVEHLDSPVNVGSVDSRTITAFKAGYRAATIEEARREQPVRVTDAPYAEVTFVWETTHAEEAADAIANGGDLLLCVAGDPHGVMHYSLGQRKKLAAAPKEE